LISSLSETGEKVCIEQAPDLVVVAGDINSTMVCTITAKKCGM
jgi:UDP-N-acetylglucosamine 2-epimerase (non-hydrolysing)